MVQQSSTSATSTYTAREVVGVFPDPEALQAAVDALLRAGFDRAAISVLASDAASQDRLRSCTARPRRPRTTPTRRTRRM